MGWFWADSTANSTLKPVEDQARHEVSTDSKLKSTLSCPMRRSVNNEETLETGGTSRSVPNHGTKYSVYNPLNYMFSDISQSPAENQKISLPTEREHSTIPKGTGEGKWEYPSPQQMYNALLRKGYTDTDVTAVESMVSVHNSLNEGAWAEIVEWERTFGRGLWKGWEICKSGEKKINETVDNEEYSQPSLISFIGRPNDMTPKAALFQFLGKIYPTGFGSEPPFDRHDWFVQREYDGKTKSIRYVIDYYSGPNDPNGEPVFFLDVRPAITPLTAVERIMRWGGNVWHKASGAAASEKKD